MIFPTNTMNMKQLTLFTLALRFCITGIAQQPDSTALYKDIKALDSLVFDIGFNQCRTGIYDSIVSEDLEFYHDIGGLDLGRNAFKTATEKNICGSLYKIKRELVPGTLKIYPLSKQGVLYGAIEEGEHTFFIQKANKWTQTGRARFTIVWMQQNGWKMKRVLSFDHTAAH